MVSSFYFHCILYSNYCLGKLITLCQITFQQSGYNAYCTSKAALDQFTRACAVELGPKNVRVNSINPSVIITPEMASNSDPTLKVNFYLYFLSNTTQVRFVKFSYGTVLNASQTLIKVYFSRNIHSRFSPSNEMVTK